MARLLKTYEWCIEHTDIESGDIEHLNFEEAGELQSLLKYKHEFDNCKPVLCLRLSLGNDDEGVQDIYYAYIVEGSLETEFQCSDYKVPKYLMKEFCSLVIPAGKYEL